MQTTENYNLNIYEGEDLFNPLTVENANTRRIDGVLKNNADNSVGTATHLKSNSVHSITRTNADGRMFTFTATSRYDIGDSFTVDGVSVTALMPNGSSLPNGVFIIGGTVLCSLVGQLLTIYSVGAGLADDSLKLGGEAPDFYAKQSDLSNVSEVADNASELSLSNSNEISNIKNSAVTKTVKSKTVVNITGQGSAFTAPTFGFLTGLWRVDRSTANGGLSFYYGNNQSDLAYLETASTPGEYRSVCIPLGAGETITCGLFLNVVEQGFNFKSF